MDNGGSMVEGGEWNSFSGVYVHEEADFMARLFPISPLNHDVNEGSGLSLGPRGWTSHESNYNVGGAGAESGSIYSDTSNSNNLYCFSQSSSYSGGSSVLYPTGEHENYYLSGTHQFLATNNGSEPIGFGMSDPKNSAPVQDFHDDRVEVGDEDDCLTLEMSCGTLEESSQNLNGSSEFPDQQPLLKRELKASELDQATEEKNADNSSNNPRKRPPNPEFQKSKRNAKSKKNHKLSLAVSNEELDNNVGHLNRQVSGSCSSEDESNASQDPSCGAASSLSSKGAINSSGKTRASRGSATDPQSLYARKRRERINERLKILQNLVPNGTKVDISTMLEEAVQYVKFLQLQIKLLSSDDMWMYAPLAYNGMDIGLDLKINGPR